jgi:hypothetical protein
MLQCEALLVAGPPGEFAASRPMIPSKPHPSAPRKIHILATRSAIVAAWGSGGNGVVVLPNTAFVGVSIMVGSMVRLLMETELIAQWDDRSRSITTAHKMTTP